ncbi:hypothetical protein RUND412_009085 [Rhizina undulata]
MPKRKNPFPTAPRQNRKAPRLDTNEAPTDLSNPTSLPPRAIELARDAVQKKIVAGSKTLFRALKKGKGFEKQKLGKRIKAAREKGKSSVGKFEGELEALKDINLNRIAKEHLIRTLLKSKVVAVSVLLPPGLEKEVVKVEAEGEKALAVRNVVARLYNSNPVKEVMPKVIGGVKAAMGLGEPVESGKKGKGKKEAKNVSEVELEDQDVIEEETDVEEEKEKLSRTVLAVRGVPEQRGANEPFSGSEDEEDEEDGELDGDATAAGMEDVWEGFSDADSDAFNDFEKRLGGSDSESDDDLVTKQRGADSDWSGSEDEILESSSAESPPPKQTSTSKSKPNSNSKPNPPRSPPRSASPPPAKKQKPAKTAEPAAKSFAFLPTLMSGYVSGSDSDPDADYYKKTKKKKNGPPEKAVRKNRMGQQARRALWMKKYGNEANHVKKEVEEKKQKGNNRREFRKNDKDGFGKSGGKDGGREGKEMDKKKEEGPLHPSWEAARKAKDRQKIVAEAMTKPVAKKIVFD